MASVESSDFDPESEQAEENETRRIIPVLLADSQTIYRVGMRRIFEIEPDIRVVSEVDSVPSLYSAVERFPTAVVILEDNLISGTTNAIPGILRRAPDVQIIIQTMASVKSNTVELYRKGVRGVISRSISPERLLQCVRKIAAGEIWIDNQSVDWIIDALRSHAAHRTPPGTQLLSPKELAIITCVTQAKKNKQIAHELGTTEQMIKNYLCKVYGKLGVSDRLELAIYCGNHDLHNNRLFAGASRGLNVHANNMDGKTNGHAASFFMAPKT